MSNWLLKFIIESNEIEGIRNGHQEQLKAYVDFLDLPEITIKDPL